MHRRWCFTVNNWTEDEEAHISAFLDEHCIYGVIGSEVGENGTPHLQGFLILPSPQRLSYLRRHVSERAHFEAARGKSSQAAEYCKKEGEWVEFGSIPNNQGKRTDIDEFKEWVELCEARPNERDVARAFPNLFLKFRNIMELVDHLRPQPELVDGEFRAWQEELAEDLGEEADDRVIKFMVDHEGGTGKSWFVRYWLSKYPNDTQVLTTGKKEDLFYAIDVTKKFFLFDVPRGGMEFFQYNVVEKIKDQVIFSPKYKSTEKIIDHKVHVVVFCNEHPDMTKLSQDRYEVVILS